MIYIFDQLHLNNIRFKKLDKKTGWIYSHCQSYVTDLNFCKNFVVVQKLVVWRIVGAVSRCITEP